MRNEIKLQSIYVWYVAKMDFQLQFQCYRHNNMYLCVCTSLFRFSYIASVTVAAG